MNASSHIRPLAIAVCAVLSLAIAAPVFAQQQAGSTSLREQRAKRMKELGKGTDAKQGETQEQQLYPNATRVSPEAKAKGDNLKALQDLQAAYEKQDYAGVIAKADAIAAKSDANAYEKSFSYQLAGSSESSLGDEAKAGEYFKKAIDANGLENNSHYMAMYNLAIVQYGQKQYEQSLATLDRFLSETKSDKQDAQQLRAALLANLGRSDEAAKMFEDQLAKNPNDKKALMNAVATYQEAKQIGRASCRERV